MNKEKYIVLGEPKTWFMRLILTLSFLVLCIFTYAQKKQKILHTNIESFRMTFSDDGPETIRGWRVVPELSSDTCYTSAREVRFITDVDSITIRLSKKKPIFDFIVLYKKKDTCHTVVKYVEIPDYIGKLKKAAKYNSSDVREVPEFTYQDMNDPNLVAWQFPSMNVSLQWDSNRGTSHACPKSWSSMTAM